MPLRADDAPAERRTRRGWLTGLVGLALLAALFFALLLLPIGMQVREEVGPFYVCGIWGTDAALAPPRGSTYSWEFGAAVHARSGVHSVILPVRPGYADREWTLRVGRLRWAIIHYPEM